MKALLLFFAASLWMLPAHAELEQYKGKFKLAMEFEISRAQAEALVDHFDWDRVQHDIEEMDFRPTGPAWHHVAQGRRLTTLSRGDLTDLLWEAAQLKPDYPPLKSITVLGDALHNLTWSRDGAKLEFAFAGPTDDPANYLARVRAFTKKIGLENKTADPSNPALGELSFHLHISKADGTDLTSRVEALNRLMLMRLVSRDVAGELFDGSRISLFSELLINRGLVRLYSDPSHFELRRHVDDPETELVEILRWLDMPEKQALAEMEKATVALCTDANLKLLGTHSTRGLAVVLARSQRGLTDPALQLSAKRLVDEGPLRELRDYLRYLSRQSMVGVPGAETALKYVATRAQENLRRGPLDQWLLRGEPTVMLGILRFSSLHGEPSDQMIGVNHLRFTAAVLELMESAPTDIVNQILSDVAPINSKLADAALARLRNKVNGTEITFLLESLGPKVLSTPKGWDAMRHLFTTRDENVIRRVRHEVRTNADQYTAAQLREIEQPTRFDKGHPRYVRFSALSFTALRFRCAEFFSRMRTLFRPPRPPDATQ